MGQSSRSDGAAAALAVDLEPDDPQAAVDFAPAVDSSSGTTPVDASSETRGRAALEKAAAAWGTAEAGPSGPAAAPGFGRAGTALGQGDGEASSGTMGAREARRPLAAPAAQPPAGSQAGHWLVYGMGLLAAVAIAFWVVKFLL